MKVLMKERMATLAVLSAGLVVGCSDTQSQGDAAAQPADAQAQDSSGWAHPMTAWGDPDLQGMWPIGHLAGNVQLQRDRSLGDQLYYSDEDFEQRARQIAARAATYEREIEGDRMGMGHWSEAMATAAPQRQTSLIVDPPNGQLPPLTAEGERVSPTMGSSWFRNTWDRMEDFDTWDRCITRGLPVSMLPRNYNNGIRIFQSPGQLVIFIEMASETRIIPTNGREPLEADIQQWLGESRGHWEGDTLVVETTNFGHGTVIGLTSAGNPGSPGPLHPFSDDMRIVERFTRTADDTIEYEMTVIDPAVLEPGSYTYRYPMHLDNDYVIYEFACHEGNAAIRNHIQSYRAEQERAQSEE